MEFDRRSFIATTAQTLGAGWLALNWPKIAAAAGHAHLARQSSKPQSLAVLSTEMARDVDAMCAQIIPTDDTPGAREAGAVYFVDRAMGGFYAAHRAEFTTDYAEFTAAAAKQFPGVRFADLAPDRQIEYLQSVEKSRFFGSVRFLTILGLLVLPGYGGNRDEIGWKLIGFNDAHAFNPPFGYYDRDYPGFVPYGAKNGS
jgi:gluconate 2-dehydrogenase gamma chain